MGHRVLRGLVGSTRSEARRRGAARHPPARADREGRRAGYRRIGSCRLQFLARAAPTGRCRRAVRPQSSVRTVTQMAKTAGEGVPDLKLPPVEIVELPRAANRPSGPRFGALVHAVLASVPLDGDLAAIQRLATIHGRVLGAAPEEIDAASESVHAALAHAVFDGARQAAHQGRCRREVPIAWRDPDGLLVEGVIDLAFEQARRLDGDRFQDRRRVPRQ